MTTSLMVLALVAVGAGVLALLAKRAVDGAEGTVASFDDVRRDLRLAVVELRVERDRVARRVDDLHRHG